jgi:aminopeptidase N
VDLSQFRNWYSQAGTPRLLIRDEYDATAERYTLHVAQTCPPTPGQPDKMPFVIPLALGLLGEAGNLPLSLAGATVDPDTADNTHRVLLIDQAQQSFVFERVGERPVPSLLRGFSAPVRLDYNFSKGDLYALMSRDDDGFVRWDSAQALSTRVIGEVEQQIQRGEDAAVDPLLLDACSALLCDESLDPAMVAAMLALPGEDYLAELASHSGGANVDTIHNARWAVQAGIARSCRDELLACYQRLAQDAPYEPCAGQIAARSLRNTCLEFLACARDLDIDLAIAQFADAGNMTDRLAALRAIVFYAEPPQREQALATFHANWRHEALVMNQWFAVQAAMPLGDVLGRVTQLVEHPEFDRRNPNKVHSLVGVFASQNPVNFHRMDGEGYRFLGDMVADLNNSNPQLASRLLTPLTRWRNYRGRQDLMRAQLERLAALPDLSADVYELVSRSLEPVKPA